MREGPNYFPEMGRFPTTVSPAQREREARERHEATDRAIRERQAEDAQLAAEREQRQREQAAAQLEAYREDRRRHWIATTGSEEGFAAAWPKLREEYANRAPDPVQRATERLRSTGMYSL